MNRRDFGALCFRSTLGLGGLLAACTREADPAPPPNILILMSDNHSWNHLGCYGDPVVKTPHIDAVAARGVRFTNAYCSAPSCTPARASMLTGQDIWRLEEGANLWGILPKKFGGYPEMLEAAGYIVGFEGKGWGPGSFEAAGRTRNPAGDKYESFSDFLGGREPEQPFCYWFSSRDPHRPYDNGTDQAATIDQAAIEVPGYLPDHPDVRRDMADYYGEVESFDGDVGHFLKVLEESGDSEQTLVIVASDNGWQMPRGLANLYDFGTRIPLIIAQPDRIPGPRVVDDFVSLNDLAPTFLELAHQPVPPEMNAKSLVPLLQSDAEGRIDPARNFVVTARERHAFVRQGGAGYGGRALRTDDYLYIRNYEPDAWPAGDPPFYGDVDAHQLHYPSPAKLLLLENHDHPDFARYFDLGFAKRPAEELYDVRRDPDQVENLAADPAYAETLRELSSQLTNHLQSTGDPRETGAPMLWQDGEYFSKRDLRPKPSAEAVERLGLTGEYSYVE